MSNLGKNNNTTKISPKKRVLFLITQSETGGAQRFLVNLAKKLDKNKYEIIFSAGPDGNWEIFNELERHNIPTHKLRYARRNVNIISDLLVIFELRKLIESLHPDVFFTNSSKTSIWGPLAINWPTKIKPTPRLIYRIGGWSFNDPRSAFGKWFWKTLEKYFAGYKDVVIVNNTYELEQAKQLGIKPKENVELVYNGVDVNGLNFLNREEARKELGLADNILTIGTVANFYPVKGLEYLIEAIKILTIDYGLSTIKCVIIGEGEGRPALEIKIKEYGLENNVVLTGRLPDARKYITAFDIFVLSSVKEGFPWAVLEAMSAKLPVVATRVGAIPEMIEDSKNGFIVEPRDSNNLAQAIKKLLDSESLRQEFGIQAHQTVLSKFDEERMVKKIEKLL
ncbi:MAG: glycosyltransferase family 4 protein [bacterium]|nr:glycosyltransferase family 4 protein [bacterium]